MALQRCLLLVVAGTAACSLTTSFDGLAGGSTEGANPIEGCVDEPCDASAPLDHANGGTSGGGAGGTAVGGGGDLGTAGEMGGNWDSGAEAGSAGGAGAGGNAGIGGNFDSGRDVSTAGGGGVGGAAEAGPDVVADSFRSSDSSADGGSADSGSPDAGGAGSSKPDAAADAAPDVASQPAFDPSTLYWIQPKTGYPTLVMDVDFNKTTDGAMVKQTMLTSMDHAEQFYILDNGNGTWRMRMRDANQCVNNPGSQYSPGAKMQMWACSSTDTWSQWVITIDPAGPNTYQFKQVANGLYLEPPNGQTTEALQLQVNTQNGSDAQKWIITPVH